MTFGDLRTGDLFRLRGSLKVWKKTGARKVYRPGAAMVCPDRERQVSPCDRPGVSDKRTMDSLKAKAWKGSQKAQQRLEVWQAFYDLE